MRDYTVPSMDTRRVLSFAFLSVCALLPGCSSNPSAPTGGGGGTTTAAAPTVTSVSPTQIPAGSATVTLTVNGTGFTSSTAIQVGTVVDATSFVSATQVTASVTAAQLSSGALLPVIALNGGSTSASGTAINLEVDNPAPKISTFAPASFTTGAASTAVTVTGTGFVPATVLQVNGASRSTTYVSATQLSVVLTTADLATAGSLTLTAVNAAPGGGTSSASSIAVNNPVPTVTAVTPLTAVAGSTTPTTITISGTGFLSSTSVLVGTSSRAATVASSTQLTFQLTVADQATAGKLSLAVVTPAPGGGTASAGSITVATPTPTPVLTSVNPTSLVAGAGAAYITVAGTNLTQSSVVLWNGAPLVTSFYYYGTAVSLSATVPANLLTATGTASITTTTPTALQPLSNALSISIVNPPPPTLTSISPAAGPINTAQTLTLHGTGFTAASTVSLNGAAVTATYVNSTSLTVALTASALTLPGNDSFTVTTPAPGGGTTPAVPFTAYIGIVNNSMVYNPVNGLLYVSVPSSAGAPYGNSVVSVDPETGALGTPILVGSEPDKLALSSDGTILWVGLDGASAVRQVNLTTATAGLQFTLGGNTGIYQNPGTALALAALPGSPNSVIVSSTNEFSNLRLAIFDSGVLRGSATTSNNIYQAYALQVDGSKNEIYAGAQSNYNTYTYSASGITPKASATSGTYSNYSSGDDMQLAGGILYTDYGGAYDAESGALLGTFYNSGSTVASGPTFADTTLAKVFILDNTTPYSYGAYNQIQVFNTGNYTQTTTGVIPISINASAVSSVYANHLTRWGTNGLAVRTSSGIYSVRSNLVKDLSSTSADLGLTLSATGSNTTGSNTTYTATITNAGPSASTNIAFNAFLPASGVLVSAQPSAGACSTSTGVSCNLGGLASGASTTVTLVVQQTVAGAVSLSAQVSGSENDPVLTNNQASSSATITGSAYNLPPQITSISPASIVSGSTATVLTVNGSGFASSSSIQVGGSALPTTFVSATQLMATVPATALATLGWTPVTVSSPAPGGGTANVVPLSIYSVITLGLNHILYDPYSRNLMASVGSGSSTVTGNSIVAINPQTAAVGTPVNIGSQPTNLALTSDGQILYTILNGSQSIARYNMLTQAADFTYTPPTNSSFVGGIALRGIAAQPGTENTIALDIASFTGNAIYDFNPTTKTAAIRGQASGPYSGSCLQFLDASNLLAFDTDTSGSTLDHYTVTSAGFTYYNYSQYSQSTLSNFGCFKLSGGLAFANAGGIANPATVPATQIGVLQGTTNGGEFSVNQALAPDASLQRAFYLGNTTSSITYGAFDGITAYDINTFLRSGAVTLNIPATEGASATYNAVDLVRWGQDGLALLTSGGHLYLMRGAFVVPQLLSTNSAATLTGSSVSTIAHGAGNTLLTVTGSNFVPGMAVTWNGAYRTTTLLDTTHATVAIPASDLATAGTASLAATNPNATSSSALTVTIN